MFTLPKYIQPLIFFAHAFGKRYDLPIPLPLFVFGGAAVVLLSFLLVIGRVVSKQQTKEKHEDNPHLRKLNIAWSSISFILFFALVVCGITGSQLIPENILPTIFWLVIWIAVPLSCGVLGDWTQDVNVFSSIAKLADNSKIRKSVLSREKALQWPIWLGWWPAVLLYFAIACGELIYNQTTTIPAFTAWSLLVYFIISGFMGLLFGKRWLQRGEIFTVLYSTWGKLGLFRFGSPGKKGFAGGLSIPFEATASRVVFVLLLLISVSFDGLLATPLWSRFQHHLPNSIIVGSLSYMLIATAIFALLAVIIWTVFTFFAIAVSKTGKHGHNHTTALAGLLPSLLPISFGYLLAHNIEYLLINGQLLFPLIGNPTGLNSWPLHLPYPFNDSFEPNIHILPSSFYWYFSVGVIIIVHVVAIILAHRHLGNTSKDKVLARRSEYPWIAAMVLYTMLSLWLIAQPLVKEKTPAGSSSGFDPKLSHLLLFADSQTKYQSSYIIK